MIPHLPARRVVFSLTFRLALPAMLVMAGGCQFLGYTATQLKGPDGAPSAPQYKSMRDQVAAVMVWTPFGIQTDFSDLRVHLATAVQQSLDLAGKEPKNISQMKGLQFPYPPASILRFQQSHQDIATQTPEQIALRLGIPKLSRFIYIEVRDFQTRAERATQLYRGSASINLFVVEIDGDKAKVAYREEGIRVKFPPTGDDPLPESNESNDRTMYAGTIEQLTRAVSKRFFDVPD